MRTSETTSRRCVCIPQCFSRKTIATHCSLKATRTVGTTTRTTPSHWKAIVRRHHTWPRMKQAEPSLQTGGGGTSSPHPLHSGTDTSSLRYVQPFARCDGTVRSCSRIRVLATLALASGSRGSVVRQRGVAQAASGGPGGRLGGYGPLLGRWPRQPRARRDEPASDHLPIVARFRLE